MKRMYILSACVLLTTAAGCSNQEENTSTEDKKVESNTASEIEQDPEALEIVENAIDTERNIESLFLHQEMIMKIEDDEEAPGDAIEEKLWIFPEEGENTHERREASMFGNPLEYMISDGEEILIYTEGDDTAHLYPAESDDEVEFADEASVMEERINTFDSRFVGEEKVNGYDTYHVALEQETESHEYWFEKDSYFTVRQVSTMTTADTTEINELNVLEFDLDPEYEEELFNFEEAVDEETELIRMDDQEG